MSSQSYTVPFIVPTVTISDSLYLEVVTITSSSPLTFQFTSPNLSFLQTSLPPQIKPSSGLALQLASSNPDYGKTTTLAGSSSGSTDGTGTGAQFAGPFGVAVDSTGNVYVADSSNHRIRKITPEGVVTTLAGSSLGFADGTGTNATFRNPSGVEVDSTGNVYVADTFYSRIRKITPEGVVTTLAGSSSAFADGTGTNARFNGPQGIAVDSAGNLYIADSSNHRIRKITPAGEVTTLAGSSQGFADGTGTNAQFNTPYGVAVDSTGNVYVADSSNHRIRKITPAGVVTTFAGTTQGSANGTGTNARFDNSYGVEVDSAGNVYVADTSSHRIRKITPAGVVTTLAGSTFGSTNGTGTNAQFYSPYGVAVDSAGNVYVADFNNNRIRKIIASENSLLQHTTGSSPITVPGSTSQIVSFVIPVSSLPSLNLAGTWMLTLYASLTESTSPATIVCQLYNGYTLLTSGTTSIIVSSMSSQPYTVPFIVPTVTIPNFLRLHISVTTSTSPITFQLTPPNLSFLQTSIAGSSSIFNTNVGIFCNSPAYPLHVVGQIFATGSITSNSDSRLKNVIGPISNGLSIVQQLNPITFTMKDDTTARVKHGFLAQEIKAILPDMVYETPNEDRMLHLSYGDLVAPLTSAIKELSSRLSNIEIQFAASQTPQ
jgi:hypothetical protein